MKRHITIALMALLALALTACGGSSAPSVSDEPKPVQQTTPAPMETAPSAEAPAQQASEAAPAPEPRSETSEVLVVYFSATGTTRGVAEKIAALTGADTYEIIAAEPYSDADLNWNDRNSRTTLEQNDKSVRPGIGSEAIDLSGYTTVYIGYPIWWGEEPRIMDTFAESYDFSGKTMIPFCTSGGSGIGRSGSNLADRAGSGTWLDGKRFGSSVSEADLQAWIDGLK